MNHISTVRQHLLDQMAALKNATGEDSVKLEISRAKGISDLAQVVVNSAKVEVEYLVATGQDRATFLQPEEEAPALPSGITRSVVHRITG